MARIIFEKREFKDNNTGIVTQYDYIAIGGTGEDTQEYEVQLKNLVQSEKMALKMIANMEHGNPVVEVRKATEGESPTISKNEDELEENWLEKLK